MSSLGDKVYAAVGTAAVVAGAAFAPGPELTATDVYTDKSNDTTTSQECDAGEEAPSYYASHPMAGLVEAASEMVEANETSEDRDLEGVQEAEYSDTSPFAEDSTFAAAHAEGEGDAFASDDGLDLAEASAEAEGEGDAFAADDGDLGDLGDAGDGDAGVDGDAGSDADGGSDGGM